MLLEDGWLASWVNGLFGLVGWVGLVCLVWVG